MNGVPGDTTVQPWPTPGTAPVPFGLSGGSLEAGTDHCRTGGIQTSSPTHACKPWCLYDLEADPSESNDLANDPKYAAVVAQLATRVQEAAATGPPWAWPLVGSAQKAIQAENCAAANRTGFYEPQRNATPPTPPPPPPVTAPVKYVRDGNCLTVTRTSPLTMPMALKVEPCDPAKTEHKIWLWQTGSIRGLPTLQNYYLPIIEPPTPPTQAYCVHIGVNPGNGTCRFDGTEHTPTVRGCYDDKTAKAAAGAGAGAGARGAGVGAGASGAGAGNPVGTGFQFTAAGGGVIKSLSCVDQHDVCLGVQNNKTLAIVPCSDARAQGWSTQPQSRAL